MSVVPQLGVHWGRQAGYGSCRSDWVRLRTCRWRACRGAYSRQSRRRFRAATVSCGEVVVGAKNGPAPRLGVLVIAVHSSWVQAHGPGSRPKMKLASEPTRLCSEGKTRQNRCTMYFRCLSADHGIMDRTGRTRYRGSSTSSSNLGTEVHAFIVQNNGPWSTKELSVCLI